MDNASRDWHLQGLMQRDNLTLEREVTLPQITAQEFTREEFGHWVYDVLRENTTSWLHYNLAALFWISKANAPKALECCRRALHHVPRVYKDIVLLNMGSVLHRSKMMKDAITVLNAAVDHDTRQASNHFMLANAYAVSGHLNSSLHHFDESLKLDPGIDLAVKHKHGVLCHISLLGIVQQIQEQLEKLQKELREYTQKEATWFQSQATFLKTVKHDAHTDFTNIDVNCARMSQLTGLDITGLKKKGDKLALIQYSLNGPLYKDIWTKKEGVQALEIFFKIQRMIKHVEKRTFSSVAAIERVYLVEDSAYEEKRKPKDFVMETNDRLKMKETQNYIKRDGNAQELEGGTTLYPPVMKINRNREDFDREPLWPSSNLCRDFIEDAPSNLEAVYPVFMPFENKGLNVGSVLTRMVGVEVDAQYELPWHPPQCPLHRGLALYSGKRGNKQQIPVQVASADYLREQLLEYVSDGYVEAARDMQDAEVGQRIHAAMHLESVPKWITYTLASLYWRVRNNNMNALNCLLNANDNIPPKYKDLVLISMASVQLEMGFFEDALKSAEEAYKINSNEPSTNFALAQMNMLKGYRNAQLFHLKQVCRICGDCISGLPRRMLLTWSCALKSKKLDIGELSGGGDICAPVEPGVNIVCKNGGSECGLTDVECFPTSERHETSSMLRFVINEDEQMETKGISRGDLPDARIFDEIVNEMPPWSDIAANERHFTRFQNLIRSEVKRCQRQKCLDNMLNKLEMSMDECEHHYSQTSYWHQLLSTQQMAADLTFGLPLEIAKLPQSSNKVPDCRVLSDRSEDFIMHRLAKIDTSGWQPIPKLMLQFTEMFHATDFEALGPKIARYLEDREDEVESRMVCGVSGWWCGAGGRGACSLRCLTASLHGSRLRTQLPLTALMALLYMQSKHDDAKDVAYLALYISPKSKTEAFLVATFHMYLSEYEEAIWMYKLSLSLDPKFIPARFGLTAALCKLAQLRSIED